MDNHSYLTSFLLMNIKTLEMPSIKILELYYISRYNIPLSLTYYVNEKRVPLLGRISDILNHLYLL